MNEALISNWNSVVNEHDTVYHLGDFSFSDDKVDIQAILKRLKGHIKLVFGNHDNPKDFGSNIEIFQYHKLRINHRRYILFHYPIEDWDGRFHDVVHLHGHVHSGPNIGERTSHHQSYKIIEGRYDVGVDNNNFTPISLEEINQKFPLRGKL